MLYCVLYTYCIIKRCHGIMRYSNMMNIKVDFAHECGKIKPMHSVNNGPSHKLTEDQRVSNLGLYKDAGIPFARTHDASFFATYGGPHTVDVHMIFPDFSRDPEDPDAYDFQLTDEYMQVIQLAGTEVFYRLGSRIEHESKKYGTLPPPDFHKWAVICEHIIRHMNEGWANGHHFGIRYWEIWNEPDLGWEDEDPVMKKCWGGTQKEFFELYEIASKHLKKCFPDLKIGGPAVTFPMNGWTKDFLKYASETSSPLDFFSWHLYAHTVDYVRGIEHDTRKMLDGYGFKDTESILNEWNYVKGWKNEDWVYSLRSEQGLKGAAFAAAVMETSQHAPLDNLMYYDVRPCAMNGLFNQSLPTIPLKGYYPFHMFNTLYKLGTDVKVTPDNNANILACAAKGDGKYAVMITHFNDEDTASPVDVKLSFANMSLDTPCKVSYYLLDETHDAEIIREEIITSHDAASYLKMTNFSTYLVTIEPTTVE